jgi:hypothetical protein
VKWRTHLANEADARRVLEVLPKRFSKYGLTLHPQKTRLVEFQRPNPRTKDGDPQGRSTFDLLGFSPCTLRLLASAALRSASGLRYAPPKEPLQ